ncbi:MAG: hypothetical protein COA86_12360 [Kangiella sp.]|nr:MAG: hypothetical protein COA86_12360 [Kangiella sp.]
MEILTLILLFTFPNLAVLLIMYYLYILFLKKWNDDEEYDERYVRAQKTKRVWWFLGVAFLLSVIGNLIK